MTHTYLTLDSVSYTLPDGRTIFSDLSVQLDLRKTALVGRNGVGKSLLGKIIAGQLVATSGRCFRSGRVFYLAQQISTSKHTCVAELAGVKGIIDALQRIAAGSVDPCDFDAVGERWNISQQLEAELGAQGLGHIAIDRPVASLSGGEVMRIALVGAYLADVEFLVLDEPSNHLDREGRQLLIEQLQAWPKGLLVISHDRELLASMERVVELSSLGLRSYGGGFSFYQQCRAQEHEQAQAYLAKCKLQRKHAVQKQRCIQARAERQNARASSQASSANQAKILLGRARQRSEVSNGKQLKLQGVQREQLSQQVKQAAQQVEQAAEISMQAPGAGQGHQARLVELEHLELPFVAPAARTLSLVLNNTQRVAITGPNGCGKSTLLKVMAGLVQPLAGACKISGAFAYLDQQLLGSSPEKSALEQLRAVNTGLDQSELRTRLAQLGLEADAVMQPSGCLSGGERLKVALACALYADVPAQLLLLDEPSNHLDLVSLQALEQTLCAYRGGLMVVSHDEVFLQQLQLTHRLAPDSAGWTLAPW
ncbi:ABC-F family ATP-binding cassette domain-containing protein [Pseudomonas segetis]|uniref:ATPase components of ABC transporters with duplicated ATPase domains n=1 Tax=Pseudomonas segetis TaxID=298908 RepID=A0A239I1T8_9PSED|nr:ABC-F family ATP-binding cassette domain-containing protein [Pseudomonas segetis]SNS87218.1 ATPase components of ABC transporters with duplicated ATPase domains [Pseudomonas segetis]